MGAILSTAIGYVSSVQRKPEVPEKFPLLTEARRLLDRAVENLRTVSHNLVRIITLTMYSDRKFVDDCKRLDIPGYILKNSGVDEVLNAIETVLVGQRYYDAKLTKSTTPDQHADDSFQRQFQLTKRELEIIGLIGQSFTNEETANRLYLSLATVKTRRNNINLKLGIKQPADLVRFAIEHGLA